MRLLLKVTVALVLVLSTAPLRAEPEQRVLGAGPSTKVTTIFFEAFERRPEAQGHKFEVEQRSTKHAGGIRASGTYLFGRTGRPLSTEEKSKGKFDIFLAGTPVGFVVGEGVGVNELSFNQAQDIFLRKIKNWKSVGGPDASIMVLGREKTEAALSVLRLDYPFLDNGNFDKIFKRDHAVVNFLNVDIGRHAIGFGAFPNFEPHQIVRIAGHNPIVRLGLVVDQKNASHEIIKAAQAFAKSEEWSTLVLESGVLLPVNP